MAETTVRETNGIFDMHCIFHFHENGRVALCYSWKSGVTALEALKEIWSAINFV
jgi:hypothetical protein